MSIGLGNGLAPNYPRGILIALYLNKTCQYQLVDIDTGGVAVIEDKRQTQSVGTGEENCLIWKQDMSDVWPLTDHKTRIQAILFDTKTTQHYIVMYLECHGGQLQNNGIEWRPV